MSDFGGLGGVVGGRPVDMADLFEVAVLESLGDQMKVDDSLCVEVWSALANQSWESESGDTASYSFRAAGDMIAAILGWGDYMDWYCSGPYPSVSERVRSAMASKGWKPKN